MSATTYNRRIVTIYCILLPVSPNGLRSIDPYILFSYSFLALQGSQPLIPSSPSLFSSAKEWKQKKKAWFSESEEEKSEDGFLAVIWASVIPLWCWPTANRIRPRECYKQWHRSLNKLRLSLQSTDHFRKNELPSALRWVFFFFLI